MPKAALQSPTGVSPSLLLNSLAGLLHEWLPRQRWFAGKGRPVTGLTLASMTELHPGCLHLLVRAEHAEQVTRSGSGTPPADNLYQLLLGVREMLPPSLAPAFIGRATEGPLTGLMVYDALQEPRSAGLLLERLRHPGAAGPLRFERDPQVTVPAGLTPRVIDAEQSNTSLVYGDSYILKVFRRVQAGVNRISRYRRRSPGRAAPVCRDPSPGSVRRSPSRRHSASSSRSCPTRTTAGPSRSGRSPPAGTSPTRRTNWGGRPPRSISR